MKKAFYIALIILVFVSCTSNLQASPLATPTHVIKIVPVLEAPTWNVYDPDPDHIWNRVFRQFYQRTAQDGKEYGLGELDPLLWLDTTYLLHGDSHQQAVQVLDEFLSMHAEALIDDPLKRAMFQRDLWAVFDWLAIETDLYPSQRQALRMRLAKIIQNIVLTKEQILSLPNNYELAVQSEAFPAEFQANHPKMAFLPSDIFQEDSAWIPIGRKDGPIAISHTNEFPFFGRSVFFVFVRSPDGRKATLDFIRSLNTDPPPSVAIGLEVALVRQMLLIDDQGDLALSPLVETIQIRHYSPAQSFYEFELDRARLLSGDATTLKVKTDLFMLFFSHGDVFERDHGSIVQAAIPDICKSCHLNSPGVSDSGNRQNLVQTIISYSRAIFPLPYNQRPVLLATTWQEEAETVIQWKLEHRTWQALKFFWNE